MSNLLFGYTTQDRAAIEARLLSAQRELVQADRDAKHAAAVLKDAKGEVNTALKAWVDLQHVAADPPADAEAPEEEDDSGRGRRGRGEA